MGVQIWIFKAYPYCYGKIRSQIFFQRVIIVLKVTRDVLLPFLLPHSKKKIKKIGVFIFGDLFRFLMFVGTGSTKMKLPLLAFFGK